MKKAGLLLVVLSIFCASLTAHAQPAQTRKTGQTVSYATGDDGDLERGVSWPTPRFEDNGDGTVTDYLTGLVWLKNANCAGTMTWNDALTYCNNLASGTCGLTDGSAAGEWRLPNKKELLSLVDYSRYYPALPQGHLFDNVQLGNHWSATTYAGYTNNAWLVDMRYGNVCHYYKLFNGYVWPVCAGQGGSFDGDVNGDGNVDLTDAILVLQVMAGITPSTTIYKEADVNGNGKIGTAEAIYILQCLSGLRIDLTGTWSIYHTETGGEEQGPESWGIKQTGNSLIVCDGDRSMNGSVSGRNITIDMGWTQLVGTVENDSSMQGTYTDGTWRMAKISDTTTCSEPSYWDVDANGIPKFVTSDHIELSKIEKISRFRSGIGHDFSDDFESCLSMKHYYCPYGDVDWSQLKIFSPIDGTIIKMDLEGLPNSGRQVYIRSSAYPAFTFRVFHVNVSEGISVGDPVTAGQLIGTHISDITMDDIAVGVNTPDGWKLVSFFDVIVDSLFQTYQDRGIQSRDDFIISKEARDSDPLNCTGESFGTSGTIENWVNLLTETP